MFYPCLEKVKEAEFRSTAFGGRNSNRPHSDCGMVIACFQQDLQYKHKTKGKTERYFQMCSLGVCLKLWTKWMEM